ncbi:hypothetical protein EKN56_03150 [Limnobaculum zhutongyuii]|uniref:DUF2997 domain-containing protein n=1 Tax=Limnobaculum zhutongyuii TaxID=2498113 RepID=A0A411WGR7_9GAMM|nr:hypothetical protein [Limnobaculum zhutongyuii]QBH95490.1 hypothetical protein EKN56_03150 [Limnobaculum zhutongyuii]TQS88821.1 hypothetical protein ELQ32_09445 [Limnobaculum zhutongyuii]
MAKIIIELEDCEEMVGVSCRVENGNSEFTNKVADIFAASLGPVCQEKMQAAVRQVNHQQKKTVH